MSAKPVPLSSRPWREIVHDLAARANCLRTMELSEELMHALEQQEPEQKFKTREPKLDDLVFAEGIPGKLFRVDAMYCITNLISLRPVIRTEFDAAELVLPLSVIRFPHPPWWYKVRSLVRFVTGFAYFVLLVAFVWSVVHFGGWRYLFLCFALYMGWMQLSHLWRTRHIRKKVRAWKKSSQLSKLTPPQK
jgi:hypothetical protein